MRVCARLLLLAALLPSAAWAHGTIPGVNQFYNGLLHPLLAPAHLLSLLSLTLLAAQQGMKPVAHELVGLAAGLLGGALAAAWAGDPDTDRWLWAGVVAVAAAVAWARPLPAAVRVGAAAMVGLAIGLGSADVALHGGPRVAALVGSVIGALLLPAELTLVLESVLKRWPHPALRIGLRVLASWLLACALLMLALAFRRGG